MSEPAPPAMTSPIITLVEPGLRLIEPWRVSKRPVTVRSRLTPSASSPLYRLMALSARTLPAMDSFPLGPAGAPIEMTELV